MILLKKLSDDTENKAMVALAAELKNELNSFVGDYAKEPKVESFNHFKAKLFLLRLHSQDALMSKRENWNALALNIFLGVISLGIALGIKALHSKLAYGEEYVSFGHESQKQEKLADIRERLDAISVPKI